MCSRSFFWKFDSEYFQEIRVYSLFICPISSRISSGNPPRVYFENSPGVSLENPPQKLILGALYMFLKEIFQELFVGIFRNFQKKWGTSMIDRVPLEDSSGIFWIPD